MTGGGITLSHLMIAMAAVELLALPLLVRSAQRSNPDSTPEQRRSLTIIIVGAAVAAAIGLCIFALLWPVARMRIL